MRTPIKTDVYRGKKIYRTCKTINPSTYNNNTSLRKNSKRKRSINVMSENGETLPIVIRNKTKQSDSDITK